MQTTYLLSLSIAFALGLAGSALARAAQDVRTDGAPSASPHTPPPTTGQSDESLSKRLDDSRGVIRPPIHVDPEILVPAPEPRAGTMPVIPPPGSPVGDPTVIPK